MVCSSANGQNIDLHACWNSFSRSGRADNGYLANHLSKNISDVTVAFPDPENVDFDILYAILFKFWSNITMRYCVAWRPFWIFGCRKFCPRVAEFGDSEWQTTCKELSYDVKISLYPICSGFTNSAPRLLYLNLVYRAPSGMSEGGCAVIHIAIMGEILFGSVVAVGTPFPSAWSVMSVVCDTSTTIVLFMHLLRVIGQFLWLCTTTTRTLWCRWSVNSC